MLVRIQSELHVMICKKKRIDKIKAMLIIANANKRSQRNFNRKEVRYYFCETCKAYHTTSKKM
jgi:hypothetical protein